MAGNQEDVEMRDLFSDQDDTPVVKVEDSNDLEVGSVAVSTIPIKSPNQSPNQSPNLL
jgi:hypothetical protein